MSNRVIKTTFNHFNSRDRKFKNRISSTYFRDNFPVFYRRVYTRRTGNTNITKTPEKFEDYISKKPKVYTIVSRIFRKIRDHMINHPSGVHMEGMGYFFVFMVPFHRTFTYRGLREYQGTFVPTYGSKIKNWCFDFALSKQIFKGVRKRVRAGHRYLNMINGVSRNHYILEKTKGSYNVKFNKEQYRRDQQKYFKNLIKELKEENGI